MNDSELEARVSAARRVDPSLGPAAQQQMIWAVRGGLQRRRRGVRLGLWALGVSLASALGALALVLLWPRSEASPAARLADAVERWDLRDGSHILPESPSTVIKKRLESESVLAVELESGAARFEVAHRPTRAFRVYAGSVTVTVTGTAFRVARTGGEVRVDVSRGSVRVDWPGGERLLSAGQVGSFPARAVESERAPHESAPPTEVAPAAAGDTAAATASSARPRAEPLESAEALFARADRARRAGRYQEAEQALAAIVERHPRDARATLAAFTRGRLLLETLGRPAEASRAFARARALAGPGSSISEDALAREVEALHASGQNTLARARAELYRALYPNGLRLRQVLRAAGLEDSP